MRTKGAAGKPGSRIDRLEAELPEAQAGQEMANERVKIIVLRYLDERKKGEPLWTAKDAASLDFTPFGRHD